ncbi:lasso RiPP family leader peptide-containing protein [Streptomyces enissocaesilis]|uniref:Lasso RiPP family leader peptide-containing protein n=1 Tax=Streptomyces enissocaesilis TaxID=332589 RepID=A0ABP6K845_9ACTN
MEHIEKVAYEAPAIIELGTFAEETGQIGVRNADEIVFFFDTWD